ncbi:MAG TPA: ribosome small subunit-dependent GTPase A [Candidatus Paenalcaligenes intestinipullorum]|uniref:Small ribosomal subunit biogenesis GTPase RsgA n=1 Tax=Candidatus Paenalcaligenes intestinipullorum TaxID=2838718 RepID=A0A9D2U7I5_9BURK|nr:ribosome small subunit-dependent GTPase A [Candidatus Paenalcaligenes intestinipullorum]
MTQPLSADHGRIIAAFGRNYLVELADQQVLQCYTRGKRTGLCVGDLVKVAVQNTEQGSIEEILPRRNLLYRSDQNRSKQFAANIDQLFIVLASEPSFSDDLTGRALVAAKAADIEPVILLNKADLPSVNHARERLLPLSALGVPILELCALETPSTQSLLSPWLLNKTTLLLGQSGMGKSTILNALVPDAQAHTQEHSKALGTGRHTTTHTRLYRLADLNASLIDSPGFQAFGLAHLSPAEIVHGFPEFHDAVNECRFYNCSHRHEPGCGVRAALDNNTIHPERYQLYLRLLDEHEQQPQY